MAEPRVYQRVGNATVTPSDYDVSVGKLALVFDGVDDFLVTNSINFTSTDKMTVFAGVRKLSDIGNGTIAELSAAADSNNGSFFIRAPAGGVSNYQWISRGTSTAAATLTGYVAPITNVLTLIGNISGDLSTIRVDGVRQGQSTSDQGTGNYGNYPIYIGRRGGTSLPFDGQIYSLIVRGAQTSDTQIAQTERWVAGKTGITL